MVIPPDAENSKVDKTEGIFCNENIRDVEQEQRVIKCTGK